jgi:hypothetical protein
MVLSLLRRCGALAVVLALVSSSPAAAQQMKVLGTDAQNDTAPGYDLTSLAVAQHGSDLHIHIGMVTLPGAGGYPQAGIQWSFMSRGKTYAVEAHQEAPGDYGFTLFEVNGGVFKQLESVDGELTAVGLDAYVPLKSIGARRGTVISGKPLVDGGGDVEVHQHAGAVSPIMDDIKTTGTFRVS